MEYIYIIKVVMFLLIGVGCCLELILWRKFIIAPFPNDGPFYFHGLFALSGPAFTIIYAVLAFWTIAKYLEEIEDTFDTERMEIAFTFAGFCIFFACALAMVYYTAKREDEEKLWPYLSTVIFSIFLAFLQLTTSVIIFTKRFFMRR